MIKFRLYYDKDKAEKFINNMSARGYAMTGFFAGLIFFEKCKPNEYTYRSDILTGKSGDELKEYIQLIEETGAEYLQRWGPWGFFRKKGDFYLYTDNESKIAMYSRIKKMFFILAMAELPISFSQWNLYFSRSQKNTTTLICASFITLIVFIFLLQAYKYNKKIKVLKEEI